MTRDEYEGDVLYGVWLAGGNPDAVDSDRVDDCFRAGEDEDFAVGRELAAQRRAFTDACEDWP